MMVRNFSQLQERENCEAAPGEGGGFSTSAEEGKQQMTLSSSCVKSGGGGGCCQLCYKQVNPSMMVRKASQNGKAFRMELPIRGKQKDPAIVDVSLAASDSKAIDNVATRNYREDKEI